MKQVSSCFISLPLTPPHVSFHIRWFHNLRDEPVGSSQIKKEARLFKTLIGNASIEDWAVAERVNGILKDEFYLDQCSFDTEKAMLATKSAKWLYSNKRLHLSLWFQTPNMVFEAKIN